jgi:hypothetical protein
MNELLTVNTGVIPGSFDNGLWLGGTIPYEVRLESGDWRPYLVTEEKQFSDNTDTMGCVSFSLNNDLEIQNNFLGTNVNFSDRFLAKMSGTTPQGNWLDKVAYTAKNTGLVLESEWPQPSAHYTWNDYYAAIPEDVITKAVKQDIAYEGIAPDKATLLKHLKQSPLQITIPLPNPNHAVVLVAIEGDTGFYFDTYPPYLKTINLSAISYALKVVLKKGNMTNSFVVEMAPGVFGICDPATAPEGLASMMLNRGIEVPRNSDGSLDFGRLNVTKKLVDK